MVRRVCVITASRADYGLLRPLLTLLDSQEAFELQLVVGGTHLQAEFGETWKEIQADGFDIAEKVDFFLGNETALAVADGAAAALRGFATAIDRFKPELVILLGDRYETLSAAVAATLLSVPIAHIHGGEITLGANDDAFRHAITKMAHIHFTAAERYRKRVIQLGESPDRVFNVGALGLDAIRNLSLLSREEVTEVLGLDPSSSYVVMTYHPVTRTSENPSDAIDLLIEAILETPGLQVVCTGANADAGGREISARLDYHRHRCPGRVKCFPSLGQRRYFSAIRHSTGVVGNSSSGIIEAPSLQVASLDIGNRQQGRLRADSVLHADLSAESIREGLRRLLELQGRQPATLYRNPYGEGYAAGRILAHLSQCPWPLPLIKPFHDIAFDVGI
jgi:UDP-hydrolysing UDP-N-acetyl-D-glucosamine 2-epimerase